MCGQAVAFLGPEQPERAWAQRWAPARAKRRAGDGGGSWSRGRRPLLVEVDPYGSDTWRLDPIIQLLQDGAVRNGLRAGVGLPCSSCTHACKGMPAYLCQTIVSTSVCETTEVLVVTLAQRLTSRAGRQRVR